MKTLQLTLCTLILGQKYIKLGHSGPGTSGLESLLSEIKLDVSRGRVAVTPSRQQYAYFQMNMLMRIQAN